MKKQTDLEFHFTGRKPKFKPGDKVKVKSDHYVGKVFEVVSILDEWSMPFMYVLLTGDKVMTIFGEDELEAVLQNSDR